MQSPLPILIIGAGPSGAFLAQIFRKANLPFRIFDREDPEHVRFQGWGVSLQWTIPVVKAALPDDMGDLHKGTSVVGGYEIYADAGFTALNGVTREVLIQAGPTHTIRCSRQRLKAYLAQHLPVEYNRICIGYEHFDGKVLAKFADGESIEGSMIIAADGAHSRIRDHLLSTLGPESEKPQLITPPKGIISAITKLTASQWRVWETLSPTVWLARCPNGTTVVAGTSILHKLASEAQDDNELIADVYILMIWDDASLSANTTAETQDRYKNYWTQNATQAEMKAFTMEKVKEANLNEVITKIWNDIPVSDFRLKPLLFTELFCPANLDPLENSIEGAGTRRVTILGDAAHPMMPFRGGGLNNALLDSATLGTLIVHAAKNDVRWAEDDECVKAIFKRYEEEMIPRGWRAIELSRQAAAKGADYKTNSAWLGAGEKYWQKGLDLVEEFKV